MILSVTPFKWSASPNAAASRNISTVSSKEHFLKGPESNLFIPCLVIEVRRPL
jgi:hypothetical protein